MKVLSIEAWADGSSDEEEGISWTWNAWHMIGAVEPVSSEEEAVKAFEDFFGMPVNPTKYEVIDDQYNYTLCVIAEDYRPIYAIEYGSEN